MDQQHQPAEPTPGPWEWDGDYTLRPVDMSGDITAILMVEHAGMVRRPFDRPLDDLLAEFAACRRLIKAAPELLKAARSTVAYYTATQPGRVCLYDNLNPCGGQEHWGGGQACPLCSARYAVAKAVEGGA